MDAHLCWAGTTNGAIDAAARVFGDIERSENARRVACNRGGMAVAVDGVSDVPRGAGDAEILAAKN
jgi:hypothetical protein